MKTSIIYMLQREKRVVNLAEGKILFAPELVVPVLRLLPQVSKSFFQLRFILGDAIDNWTHVGKRVWWTDPVMGGAGQRSDGRSLQGNNEHMYIVVVNDSLSLVIGQHH